MFGDQSIVELPNLQVFSTVLYTAPVQIMNVPKLSALCIPRDAIDPFMDSLSTLRCLICYTWAFTRPVPTTFDILKNCPNLRYLHWQDYGEDRKMIRDSNKENLHFPFLEVFKITVKYSLLAQGIVHRLCTPTLKSFTLNLTGPFLVHTSTPALYLLLGTKVSQLCRLSFHRVSFTEDYKFSSFPNSFPLLVSLCLDQCTIGPVFFPSSIQDSILPRLKTLHLRHSTSSASNLTEFVRSQALPDSIRTHTPFAGLYEVLIEDREYMELPEEERLKPIRLQDEYGDIVVTSKPRSRLVHDCSLHFHEAKHMQRITCGDQPTSTL
ncbi:hypothetical protein K439DRAFT_1625663 [Ramaria rubella]|nr:hypothetical protein K439DRAFT_1625663 [Ramaria rubella]